MTQFSVPWTPRHEGPRGFLGSLVVGIAKAIYAVSAPIVSRIPGIILLSALVLVIIGVWLHAMLFAFVNQVIVEPAQAAGIGTGILGLSTSQIAGLLEQHGGVAAWLTGTGIFQYLMWPLQFQLVRDLIALVGILGLFNIIPVYLIWWERKVAGRIQSRLGPMRVGGWHGWAQSFADGIKLVLKEDLVPEDADKILFRAAPYFAIIPVLATFVALPFGATYIFRELDVALVFILAMLGIEVVGVIMAGWASNNKWSVYGAMREACQMVSYEIPLGMALLVPVVTAGTLSLRGIGETQSGGWFSWLVFQSPFTFVAFGSYYVASLASCKRAPFDLPEAESELVAGFHTEYSGFRWAVFFFAEYVSMFVVAGLATILFLGGWNSPLPQSWAERWDESVWMQGLKGLAFSGPIWFMLKAVFLLYVQIWLRWTLPRIRLDQVLYGCIQVMLPLTMLLLLGTALWVWVDQTGGTSWSWFAAVCRWVLGSVGLVFVAGFFVIAAYGFFNRRRMVGNLVVDALPGS